MYYIPYVDTGPVEPFDLDLIDEDDPFEIGAQLAHQFSHEGRGLDDVYELWESDPLFYRAKPPADWLMVGEISGDVLVVPLARPNSGDTSKCRPIGCYVAGQSEKARYRADRNSCEE